MIYKMGKKGQAIIARRQAADTILALYRDRAAAMADYIAGRKVAIGSGDTTLAAVVTGVTSTANHSKLVPDVNIAINVPCPKADAIPAGLSLGGDLPTIVELTREAERHTAGIMADIQALMEDYQGLLDAA